MLLLETDVFLRCQNYISLRRALTTKLKNISYAIMSLNENDQLHVVRHGNKNLDNKTIKDSERLDQPLF